MKFYMPVTVYEETDCVRAHAGDLASLGRKAMIVTGRSSAIRCGAYDDVKDALEAKGVDYVLFDSVEENPSVETIMRAREIGKSEQVDFVIGIGGGSPMDAAKAIALMILHSDQDWQYMYDAKADSGALPVALIPTTCGTGSEVTGVSVLTRHDTKTKGSIPHKIYARYALMDGRYLKAAPHSVLANTTMDALAHLVESYINTNASVYSRMCAEKGIEIWAKSKDVLLKKREAQEQDYVNMMDASCMAGMAIAQSGTSLPHALGYRLTYDAGVPHGKACAFFLARYIEEADPADAAKVLKLSGFSSAKELDEYFTATCGPVDVPESLIEQSVKEVYAKPAKLANAPFPVDEALMMRVAGL